MNDYGNDEISPERCTEVARRMLRRFSGSNGVYDAIRERREHYYRWEAADPQITYPEGLDEAGKELYAEASKFQSTDIQDSAVRLIDRICENGWQVTDEAPDQTGALETVANNAGQILSSWGFEIEERQSLSIQRQLSYPCVRDKGYAVFHVRHCADLWPEIDWSPGDKDEGIRETDEDEECSGCDGEAEDCPQCEGTGTYTRRKLTLHGPKYMEPIQYEYAKRGAPWTWESVDPLECAWEEDNDPRGGLRRFVRHREVDISDYCDEQSVPKARELRAAASLPGSQHGEFSYSTPTSDDGERNRAVLYQLWTRSHLYEWVEFANFGTGRNDYLVKQGKHGYPRIPFRIVAPRRTGHPDPMWAFECDMDRMYAVVGWVDRQVTLMGKIMENQAQPLLNERVVEPGKTALLADGTPDELGNGTTAGQYRAGFETEVISQPMPEAVVGFWQELKEMMQKARPETGDVDSDQKQAWAIRLQQAQSGKGPRAHIAEHQKAMQWGFQLIMDWHEQHKERLVAFPRDSETRLVSATKPLVVEPGALRFHQPKCYINDVSAAEQQMEMQFEAERLQMQLITHEDYYKTEGAKDPKDRAANVMAYWTAYPYVQQAVQRAIAEKMGSTFTMGLNGEMLNGAGQMVTPDQVLGAKGYTPGGPPAGAPPGRGGGNAGGIAGMNAAGGGAMPGLPALDVAGAGVAALPGMR